jgi:hypothetical protein
MERFLIAQLRENLVRMVKTFRSGMASLPVVLLLGIVIVIMGVSASIQTSSCRRTLETVYLRRLVDVAIESALDEACARVQNQLRSKAGSVAADAETSTCSNFPRRCALTTTLKTFEPWSIAVEPVQLDWSTLQTRKTVSASNGGSQVRKLGVVELAVKLHMKNGGQTLRRSVKARRFVVAEPDSKTKAVRWSIQSNDLMLAVVDQ